MNPEEAKQVLDNLAPGELEQIIRDSIISEEDRERFRKHESDLLYKTLYPTSGGGFDR